MVKKENLINKLQRGHVIKVSLDPVVGHEQSGYRPALVISSKDFHVSTGFALCIPVTSKKKGLLFEIDIAGSKVQGVALPHCARILDLQSRDFVIVDNVSADTIEKAQIILSKIVNE